MKVLRCVMFIIWSLILIPTASLASLGMPAVAFKNVGACFKPGFKMYAPMFGSMALSSGFIENLRLYNVIPGSDEEGERMYVKDRALDNDPVMEIILILFPSPAGQLTTEGAGSTNIGNYFEEVDVAKLFNVVYGVRNWLAMDKKSEEKSSKKKKVVQKKKQPLTEFSIILEKRGLGNHLKKMDINVDTFIAKITEKSSEKRFKKNLKRNLESLFVNIVKALEQETSIHKKTSEYLNKEEEKEEEEENESTEKEEKVVAALDDSCYPKHMVEQVIGAFFCHKFARQENIRNLLLSLHEDIVDKEKIANIDRLLQEDDLFPAQERIRNGDASLDDIWLALHKDNFKIQILPYKNNQDPISNGIAAMYLRASDEEEGKEKIRKPIFADCAEVTIRHMMNFILFDSIEKTFSLEKLDQFMADKDQTYIKNLKEFYAYQTPDLANSGDYQVRSLWNQVVADLGGNVIYLQKFNAKKNNNEIESGILNFVQVFERIFNLELGDEPTFIKGQENKFIEQIKNRFFHCFKILFEELSPKKVALKMRFSNIKIFSIHGNHDLSGDIAISINDKHAHKHLFSFVLLISNEHIEINNLKIDQKNSEILESVAFENIVKNLNQLSMEKGSASFFLADELIEYDVVPAKPIYQIFGKTLNDTNGKIRALNLFHNLSDYINEGRMSFIIENIIKSYLWNDESSVKKISQLIFDENKQRNKKFQRIISEKIKKINLENSNIETLNVSEFSVLKTIKLSDCQNFKSLNGLSKSIELIHLDHLKALEVANLSNFSALKVVRIRSCQKLESLNELSENIELLHLWNVNIETIDLSRLQELKRLTILESEKLKSLDKLSTSIESLDLHRLNIKTFDVSKLQALKKVIISNCERLRFIHGFSENIKSLDLSNVSIEILDLSRFQALEKITIINCKKIKSILISELLPNKLRKKLEVEFPGKVKGIDEHRNLQDESSVQCTIS
ncbi:hypothetical protein JKY79_03500 [Candidatus Babeliales bacterium]|nr:hypothetical protein [Candidatus Babeliales bacterium]